MRGKNAVDNEIENRVLNKRNIIRLKRTENLEMNKSKEKILPIIKYLRELSIVVAGIAITVGIGLWVNNNNYKEDQKQY